MPGENLGRDKSSVNFSSRGFCGFCDALHKLCSVALHRANALDKHTVMAAEDNSVGQLDIEHV